KSLENLGLTVYYLANPTDLDGMYAELETVGKLTGKEAQAEALIPTLKARVDAVTSKLAQVKTHPSVYYELDATDPTKPWTSGPGTFVDKLITLAGGQNVGSDLKDTWAQISAEAVIAKNPQVILLGDAAYGTTPQSVVERPGWNVISAVKNNRVLTFDDNLVSRPTPRLVDGLETLAKLIHPEAFQ
ncbi:MAG TPA: ABC transporter substrate-binding protein, partial [Candidatus Methylomirabilis sp.]|nr:ABC transporter substrate-binding protein [Candidatus Methylomirabilis sp.]